MYMVFRRRIKRKFKPRTRRFRGGRSRFQRVPRSVVPRTRGVYSYKQIVDGIATTGIAARFIQQQAVATHYAVEFRADSLPQWSTLSSLYDQYRINKVVLKLIPMMNVANAVSNVGSIANAGMLMSVIDYDDSTLLGSLNDYLQYANCKSQAAITNKVHTRILRPALRGDVLQSGGAMVPASVKHKQWLDCGAGAITHNGVKIYLDAWQSINAAQCYQVFITYYISFKGVR